MVDTPGLFLSREVLDFGAIKSGESKTVPIFVLNSGAQQVYIRVSVVYIYMLFHIRHICI